MEKLLSACGLDCYSCECREAYLANDEAKKADIAMRWSKQYDAELTADDIKCDGCMSAGEHFSWCNKCPIRACVTQRGYQNCAACPDFPCDTNGWLYQHVPEAKKAIESIR